MNGNNDKNFIVYPAIDIIDGKCVRLTQGDYEKVKVYSEDPLSVAEIFYKAGAQWIHVVDLDAAKSGIPANNRIISKIALESGLFVQTGGGIRNMETLDMVLSSGVKRAILGTGAVKNKDFTMNAIKKYGTAIVIGIDARDGMVAVDGWTNSSDLHAVDFAIEMERIGARTVIYTDISRDGMLKGTELEGLKLLVEKTDINIIASGGVADISHVIEVKNAGAAGIIIGKAIYEGKVDLKECLQNV